MTHLTAFNPDFICTNSRALCACFSCKKYVSTWRHTLSQHYIHKTISLRSVVSCFGADTIFICDIIMRFRFQTNERTLFDYMRCSFCMIFEICNIYDKIIPVLSEDLDAIVKKCENATLNRVLLIGICTFSDYVALTWIPKDLTDDKSALSQVKSWWPQAMSRYRSSCCLDNCFQVVSNRVTCPVYGNTSCVNPVFNGETKAQYWTD